MRIVVLAVVIGAVGLVLGVTLKGCQEECTNQVYLTKNCAMTPGVSK